MSSGIESQMVALVASTLRVEESAVHPGTSFAQDLAADPLGYVTLILAGRDVLKVDIPDEEAAEILTVGQMIEYVNLALALKELTIVDRATRRAVGIR